MACKSMYARLMFLPAVYECALLSIVCAFSPVTENSRRFDQPISRRRGEATSASGTTAAAREEKKSDIDSWYVPLSPKSLKRNITDIDIFSDLLGSIIPEQMKTLAPGRLFAVRVSSECCHRILGLYDMELRPFSKRIHA